MIDFDERSQLTVLQERALLRFQSFNRRVNWIRVLVAVSFGFTIIGHWQLDGEIFDPINGERYNLYTRWVSDFAGRSPEGYWIKAGMVTFSAGLFLLLQPLSTREAVSIAGVWRGFAVLILATLMSGGLILVSVFDISPKQYTLLKSQAALERTPPVSSPAAAESPPEGTLSPADEPTVPDPAEENQLPEDNPPLGEARDYRVTLDEQWQNFRSAFSSPEATELEKSALEASNSPTLREELMRSSLEDDHELDILVRSFRKKGWDDRMISAFLHELAVAREQQLTAKEETGEYEDHADSGAEATDQKRRPRPLGEREVSKQLYHRLGFHLFLAGFAGCSLWMAYREWRRKSYDRLPGTLLTMFLSLVFAVWLFYEKLGLAGIPQRALLVLIGIWVLRNTWHLSESDAGSRRVTHV